MMTKHGAFNNTLIDTWRRDFFVFVVISTQFIVLRISTKENLQNKINKTINFIYFFYGGPSKK